MTSVRAGSPDDAGLVLVVDDGPDSAETTALMLRERGVVTESETDPRRARGRLDDAIGHDLIDSERRRIESVCYTRDGETILSDITAAPMAYGGESFLLTIMRPRGSDEP